ncbi:hypothetical protein FSP39_013544 [Pinctada imbricata]|uniref:Peptidase S1 domain-containing protein n=1 Tax=Pinctada imbricata TaxID=66713 RepID=A0AA88YJ30_PINIB|nr:hypothetical protein FSP39_013544 [Pinctada imbricata]
MAVPKVAFPNADLIANSKGIQHPSQKLIEEARMGESRIVGGSDAKISNHPWQVSLQGSTGNHFCGASLVHTRWLVTAAHCVDGARPSQIKAKLGTTNFNDGGITMDITRIIMHRNYNKGSGTYPNDIALLELEADVATGANIQTITMAEGSEYFENENCVISGWGLTDSGGSVSSTLQAVSMTVMSKSNCQSRWGSSSIIDSHVCVHKGYGTSACMGDSGGPLVCRNNILVGATSWGSSTCSGDLPSVYTRISSFRSWIRDEAGI